MGRLVARTWLALVGLQVVLGLAWIGSNAGEVTGYGDTRGLLGRVWRGEVELGRGDTGIGYPLFLDACAAAFAPADWGESAGLDTPGVGEGSVVALDAFEGPDWLVPVQWIQFAASVAAFAYAARVATGAPLLRSSGGSALGRPVSIPQRAPRFQRLGLAIVAAVALDPANLHYQFSILADGPALTAVVIALAAWIDLVARRSSPRLAPLLLVLAATAAGTLRIEKQLVVPAAGVLASAVVWLLARLRASRVQDGAATRALGRRALLAGALLVPSFVLAGAVNPREYDDSGDWTPRQLVLLSRVVYPHLTEIYPELSPETRAVLKPAHAVRFDLRSQNPRLVLRQVAGDDAELVAALIDDMAATALRERWLPLVLDVLRDAAENVVPTPGFYARVAAWRARGSPPELLRRRSWEPVVTYAGFASFAPRIAPALAAVSGLAALIALGAVVARVRRLRPTAPWLEPGRAARWVPVAAFLAANAAVFALSQDLTELRYSLAAHALLVGGGGWAALTTGAPARRDTAPER